ncbi:unnamed protein product [Lactuca virosa]|uniref:E2 ubiquitin-conjugating enzyme n=1 Tax=Lactuca virosa TaxID=75947 RepID=A0AAU9MEE4_9ASTR|nr:unnamed protein product [Lactuca virosa]
MAQAARLNLRMQKEVKLLLTDPPPGASFPHLSPTSDLSSFSLTAIDAQIQGPEDTVYEKGVFKIKIQIPERYPFQPPIVTFATPIYHPNIDTGGRICLDILNLPPKGAWQPSLNISTVLTSIGLLLSEPNPDDGLMCEASKEYKYNKQVFDQKARSMTEKYAKSDTSGSKSNTGVNEEPLNLTPQSQIQEPKQDHVWEPRHHISLLTLDFEIENFQISSRDKSNKHKDSTDDHRKVVKSSIIDNGSSRKTQSPDAKRSQTPPHRPTSRCFFPSPLSHLRSFFLLSHRHRCPYPFQPPIVTFATPIYHPNIDTGGRICLDILNLPPKGAWQPSLNISTVLTSIGLLLSEPNPDDGLMCEASKEYKYNKQVFDQKARSMTEKYAKSDTSGSKSNTGVNEEPLNLTPQSQIQEPKQDHDHDQDNIQESIRSKKLRLSSKNLQQEAMDSTKDSIDGPCFRNPKRKKLGLSGKKQSLGFLSIPQNKENDYNGKTGSFGSNMSKVPQDDNGKSTKLSRKPLQVMEENDNHKMKVKVEHGNSTTSDLKDCGERSEGEGLCDLGEVIVLDSEDSEEETTNTMKSRRLIARKRLLGKY